MNLDYLIYIIGLILIIVVGIFVFAISVSQENSISKVEKAFCGGALNIPIDDSALAGRTLFKNNCAQCHARNMKSDATGPALEGFFDKWNRDTISLIQYLNNAPEFKSSVHYKRLKLERRFDAASHTFNFQKGHVEDLLNYINI